MDPHERLGPNQSAKIEAECLTTAQSTAKMQVRSGSKSLSVVPSSNYIDPGSLVREFIPDGDDLLEAWTTQTHVDVSAPKVVVIKFID
jgi:hypothetical protein